MGVSVAVAYTFVITFIIYKFVDFFSKMRVSEVLGHGRQKGITEVYRGARETGNLLRKVRLEIAVNDNFLEPVIKAIVKGAKTGEAGDGKIFVLDLKECVRIRTEERGAIAIG